MNGPGGWIVQSVLYLHQTVKPLPLLIICHNFTEHTLRPKGSLCPVACPFPPLSGRPLFGQGARGRGPPSEESFLRPLLGLFPLDCPRSPRPKVPVPWSGTPRPLSPVSPCWPWEVGSVLLQPERASRKHPSKFPARFLAAGDMRPGGRKTPRFPRANGGKTTKARPKILLQQPIFLLPLVFLSVTVKSPFFYISSRCIFQQRCPLLYSAQLKPKIKTSCLKVRSSGRCRG